MNKIPWFTHDNDAHEDAELRAIFRKHGGILRGFGLWWLLIEVLDRHGKGDKVAIAWRDFESLSDCRRINLRPLLCSLAARGKLSICEDSASILSYEMKKFRERQSKLKSKLRSILPQSSSNLPQDRDREGDIPPTPYGEGERTLEQTFKAVWDAYPKKAGYGPALDAWSKLNPDIQLYTIILAAIQTQAKWDQWTRDDGRWIPELATWLKEKRWKDEGFKPNGSAPIIPQNERAAWVCAWCKAPGPRGKGWDGQICAKCDEAEVKR